MPTTMTHGQALDHLLIYGELSAEDYDPEHFAALAAHAHALTGYHYHTNQYRVERLERLRRQYQIPRPHEIKPQDRDVILQVRKGDRILVAEHEAWDPYVRALIELASEYNVALHARAFKSGGDLIGTQLICTAPE